MTWDIARKEVNELYLRFVCQEVVEAARAPVSERSPIDRMTS